MNSDDQVKQAEVETRPKPEPRGKHRTYYVNKTITVDGYDLSVTAGGSVYLVERGVFKRISAKASRRGLLVDLPNGKKARLHLVMGKLEAGLYDPQERENAV